MLIEGYSGQLSKALLVNNQQNQYFTQLLVSTSQPAGDGVFNAGLGGVYAQKQLFLFPYAQGEPGVDFWVRVYGWRNLGQDGTQVWIPELLAELYCVASQLSGATGFSLGATEYLASTILLSNGQVGNGFINSPGGNLLAYACLDLLGCQMFQFDFAPGEEYPSFPNALWCFA